ncbi:toxin glutamine deamidase domain-containing protein [Micromonospora sp. NPDC049662]|uniref:toxin glutamine deamidase domain-containing protein n=1 Tax=Micromonospora sp. NPDC049662 TaxID=3155397 RepID=UPI0034380A03
MSVLPSPIPHPLDYAPWDVPGWIYEALDWAVGVQWPEGNERAVWDVADQWYAVASVLAGPHADAAAAATEVRGGYGGVGAVDAAFEAAWRGIAEGADAPLPVLLAVTADLGRLVEECGCDIEGAKIEVWIELGILVVELISVAVAALLTAGAASPAAGAAVTATRLLIQQIFKRLMGQLASKALRRGLKEAGERAAKEVAKGGVRGLAKRATREGLEEAAEESGISLATQTYQNSTGRAHGVDLTDLGASAVGGLAGGAVAPLAALGRHVTGRAARIGEHLGREMTGEMLAESAASVATGQGMASVDDVVRAAASGVTGSTTAQTDHALQARLRAQADALAGASLAGPSLPIPPPPPELATSTPVSSGPVSPGPATGTVSSGPAGSGAVSSSSGLTGNGADVADSSVSAAAGAPGLPADGPGASAARPAVGGDVGLAGVAEPGPHAAAPPLPGVTAPVAGVVDPAGGPGVGVAPAVAPAVEPAGVAPGVSGPVPSSTGLPGSAAAVSSPVSAASPPTALGPSSGPLPSSVGSSSTSVTPTTGPVPAVGAVPPVGPAASTAGLPTPTASAVPAPAIAPPLASPFTSTGPTAGASPDVAGRHGAALTPADGSTVVAPTGRHSAPESTATRESIAPPRVPRQRTAGRTSAPVDVVAFGDPMESTADVDDWYAAQWLAEAEAAERRRYQGHFEAQRIGFENNRRQAEAVRLRARAAEHDRRAVEYANYARQLHQTGHRQWADGWQRAANDETRAYAHWRDLANDVLAGITAPPVVDLADGAFAHANSDVGALALGAVETGGPSRLTGDDVPPPIDDSRPYGQPGGLRPPLALHQVDVERQMPRERDGTVRRTADPRRGGWFRLLNDGGPQADATRGINCLDCTLSLFETWVHGRPRVSAPRTFDGYLDGDIRRPIRGEAGGPGRVEDATGGRFQRVLTPGQPSDPAQARQGYANLHDQLLLGGHGSYAFLITEWAGGGSHAWVALNQNGTVLYVDPQTGLVRDHPLYPDVVGIDALVLGGDGRPMPLGGLPRGRFSERPDLPTHPPGYDDGGHGDPYVNRMYLLLDGPGSTDASGGTPSTPRQPALPVTARLTPAELATLTELHESALANADRTEGSLVQVARRVTNTLGLSAPIELRERESRVKPLDSLMRKYLDEASIDGKDVTDFAASVNDVLRFCFELPSGQQYSQAVDLVLAGLVDAGYSVAPSACKNFWRQGNRFYGVNCTLRSTDGMLIELQLHTPASREVWLATHEDYEVVRRPSNSPQRRVGALLRMLAANRARGLPEALPAELDLRFPPKDATFAKWVSRNSGVWHEYLAWLAREGEDFAGVVRELGLARRDFPVTPQVVGELEQGFVELLRDLPE